MVELAVTRLAGDPASPGLLVVGPSLGTSAETLWGAAARLLAPDWEVVGWDLPGHGRSRPATGPFGVGDLAAAVRSVATRAAAGRPATYAGVSLGGATGFQLGLARHPFTTIVAIASASKMGEADMWHERADLVRRAGTPVMVASSSQRWFAPGFTERDPRTASALLTALSEVDQYSYAWACEALAAFDLRGQVTDVLVVAGEHDIVVPPDVARSATGTVRVLAGCGHLPPAEDPTATAALLTELLRTSEALR